ncbi:Uncharacterised protein [Sphingobacterium spiritivorum]|uniref:Uncharacterized protein n=1 Tax=Sphingobacterium spiritivorum TaxID=258 RepID=A0A380BA81_SPHSI|nr:Uncharacterised protein [Sphingobacterium spiritivorum]
MILELIMDIPLEYRMVRFRSGTMNMEISMNNMVTSIIKHPIPITILNLNTGS